MGCVSRTKLKVALNGFHDADKSRTGDGNCPKTFHGLVEAADAFARPETTSDTLQPPDVTFMATFVETDTVIVFWAHG